MSFLTHTAVRYVVPLREGGSMPAIVDTDEGGLFVTKFRGAGQGAPALVAELVVGGLAQAAGLPMPELALIELDAAFGRTEPDPEIQDILRGSHGLNVGLRYLKGAFPYDPVAAPDLVSPELAADLVWFDAYTTNIDRTPRNPNLLIWQRELRLIDHGAAIYVHYNWSNFDADRIHAPFPPIRDHVLLPRAGGLDAADARMTDRLDADVVRGVLAAVPDALLMAAPGDKSPPFDSAEAARARYIEYLAGRLNAPRRFVEHAIAAQDDL
jgi:hypothetical protein